jgi:hypothetical protein
MTALNDLIRKTVATNPNETSLRELANLVEAATPKQQLREFYQEALPEVIREVMAQDRNANRKGFSGGQVSAMRPVRSGKSVKSSRMADISENNAWRRRLDDRLGIPGKGYIRLGECTVIDLREYAKSLRSTGDAMYASAADYDHMADLLEAQGVEYVRDLREAV